MFIDRAAPAEARPDNISSDKPVNVEELKVRTKKLIEQQYFAAAPSNQIANNLAEKVYDWINYVNGTAHFRRIQKSYAMYFGWSKMVGANSSEITQGGPLGQYSLTFINEFRNTVKHVVNMITQQAIKFECHGANTDTKTTESCEVGEDILEHVLREKGLNEILTRACEYGCFLSEGTIALDWDHWKGTPYTVDEIGQPVFDGDMTVDYFAPWNVIKDHWQRDGKGDWRILVRWKNKYDLAAKYPEKAAQIISTDAEALWKYQETFYNQYLYSDCDMIPELTFLHNRTPALPEGRYVKFLDNSTLLLDVPLPFKEMNVFTIEPDHLAETCHGYTFAFDLLSVQDLQNLCDSIAATMFKTLGIGIVKLPEGHNMKYTKLAEGLQAMVINETNGRAEAMNFSQLPPGLFDWRAWLSSRQDIIAGINSVIKGIPDSNIKAGNFAALIAAQAYQFSNALQKSYADAAKRVGQGIIEMYQTFANTKRVVTIIGKNKAYATRSFQKTDLQDITTVTVDIGNPATSTTAMKMQIASDLLDSGKISTSDEFIDVIKTGNIEHVLEPHETEMNNINRENEMLREGKTPPILKTDNPVKHATKHLSLLDDPVIRETRPDVVQATLAHALEHIQDWQALSVNNPAILALKNVPPAPMPGGMMSPPPPEGGPISPPPGGSPLPNLPEPAKNPLTGESPVSGQPIEMAPTQAPPAA